MRKPVDTVMVEQRANSFTRRSIKTASKEQGLRLALSMIDLTTLEGKDSPEKVRSLCAKAILPWEGDIEPPLPSVAAVCVYPSLVQIAKRALEGSTVAIASVATGFPSGQYPIDVRLDDVTEAVKAGADEIDMVINRGAFLSG
jgi:deoxyribose-phosphate aldolase